MTPVFSLVLAVEFIERSLTEAIGPEDVAAAAFVSPSHIYKLFSRVFHCSPGEYITKRRLCRAADALVRERASVTVLAFLYQYGSVESFSRAFKKQYLMPPSAYRKRKPRFTDIYPKYVVNETEGAKKMGAITQTPYNMSELTAGLLSARGTYFLLVDLDHFKKLNDSLTHEAGDAALAATASRLERSIKPGMLALRIGGEEFGVITGLRSAEAAEEIAKTIISFADEEVTWRNGTFKFTMSVGIARIPEDSEDAEQAMKAADEAMYKAKINGRNGYYRAD